MTQSMIQSLKQLARRFSDLHQQEFKTVDNGLYLHIGVRASADKNLYIDLIEPLGHEAEKHDQIFKEEKDNTYNRLTREFMIGYCDEESGAIDWTKLVRFVSGNMPS